MNSGHKRDEDESSSSGQIIVSENLSAAVKTGASSKDDESLSSDSEESTSISHPQETKSNDSVPKPKHLLTSENQSLGELDYNVDLTSYVKEHNNTLTFPEKLMITLTHVERECARSGKRESEESIGWILDGKAFVIRSKERLCKTWIPVFFGEAKFSSFTRKLYRWGFRKVNIAPDMSNPSALYFGNDNFQRDNKSLLRRMRSITAAKTRKETIPENLGNAAMAGNAADIFTSFPIQWGMQHNTNNNHATFQRLQTQNAAQQYPAVALSLPPASISTALQNLEVIASHLASQNPIQQQPPQHLVQHIQNEMPSPLNIPSALLAPHAQNDSTQLILDLVRANMQHVLPVNQMMLANANNLSINPNTANSSLFSAVGGANSQPQSQMPPQFFPIANPLTPQPITSILQSQPIQTLLRNQTLPQGSPLSLYRSQLEQLVQSQPISDMAHQSIQPLNNQSNSSEQATLQALIRLLLAYFPNNE